MVCTSPFVTLFELPLSDSRAPRLESAERNRLRGKNVASSCRGGTALRHPGRPPKRQGVPRPDRRRPGDALLRRLCERLPRFGAGRPGPNGHRLDGDTPTVTLAAEHAKNGRTAVQPLPPDIAEALRGYLAGRPADQPVWPGVWRTKAAEMFRLDLGAAGIPYVVEGTDGPLYADFHALRHSDIALPDKSGATLKEAMQLARHSDPKLTMAVYGRARLHDLGQAVRRLPALPTGPTTRAPALAATGTDGQSPTAEVSSSRSACARNDAGRGFLRVVEKLPDQDSNLEQTG